MKEKKKCIRLLRNLIVKILMLGLIGFIIFNYVIGVKFTKGISMYPSIKDGDLLVYYRLNSSYSIDDVIVYDVNGIEYCGRIVAMNGDRVDISDDGELIINGNVQNENIFYPTYITDKSISYPVTVGENSYYVLSDNRVQGVDSRMTGDVSIKNIKGKLITILRIRGF